MIIESKEQIVEEIEKYIKWLTSVGKKFGIVPKYNLNYIENVRNFCVGICRKCANKDVIAEVLLYLERLTILHYRKKCKLYDEEYDI